MILAIASISLGWFGALALDDYLTRRRKRAALKHHNAWMEGELDQ